MRVVAIESFFASLARSGLLTDRQLADLRAEIKLVDAEISAQEFAARLVERQVLTRWQAGMILSGQTALFLGKYKLLKELGRGGMGAVFQAEQVPLGRIVALKVMSPELVRNPTSVARFQREIQAAAALNHPNIVTAFDADQVQNTHFLVMEYVEGEGLHDILKGSKCLPIPAACEFARQAALGLQHAHDQGMAHRDIKPSNLLVTKTADGKALIKILDLGLARFTSETREVGELTNTGQVMGTPDYIAPEQAKSTRSADIRSDIFSLGCTLFRMLTGRLPFGGESVMEKLSARLLDDAPLLRAVLPDAPAELERVVARMLSREPAARPQTPQEVANDLAPFCGGAVAMPAAARLAATPVRLSSGTGESSPAGIATAPEELVLHPFLQDLAHAAAGEDSVETFGPQSRHGGVAGEGTLAEPQAAGQRHPAAQTPLSRAAKKVLAERDNRRRAERRQLLWGAGIVVAVILAAGAWWGWEKTGETTIVLDWPDEERENATLEVDGRARSVTGLDEVSLRGPPGRQVIAITRDGYEPVRAEWNLTRGAREVFRPEWTPTPETARRERWSQLRNRVRDMRTDLMRSSAGPESAGDKRVIELQDELVSFHWGNSGTKESLDAAQQMTLLPWPVDLLKREQISAEELRRAGNGDAATAPAELVAVFGDSRLKMWGIGSGIALDPEGKRVASVGHYEAAVYLWDAHSGELLRKLPVQTGPTSVSFSGDGLRVASGGVEACSVWDSITGALIAELPQQAVVSVALNRDGTKLAAAGAIGNTFHLWDVASKKPVWSASDPEISVRQVAISPDDRFVSYHAEQRKCVEVHDATNGALLRQIPASLNSPSQFTDDGSLLFLTTAEARIQCWETATWSLRHELDAGMSLLAVDATGERCLAGSGTGISVWKVSTAEKLWSREVTECQITRGSLNRDGTLAAIVDRAGGIQLWDVASDERAVAFSGPLSAMVSVRVTPDGRGVVGGNGDGSIRRWEFGRGEATYVLPTHPGGGMAVGFTADGATLVTAADDERIRLWDARTGERVDELRTKKSPMGRFTMGSLSWIAISRDGRYVAVSDSQGSNTFTLLDLATRQERSLAGHSHFVSALAFSADGAELASGCQNEAAIKIWNVRTGRDDRSIEPRDTIPTSGHSCLVFDPLSTALYSAGHAYGTNVVVWNPETGRKTATWSGHTNVVTAIAVSPDGRRVATAAVDGTIILWTSGDHWGEPKRTITVAPDETRIFMLEFTPDGRHLVTANGNGTIYVLRLQEWSAESKDADLGGQ